MVKVWARRKPARILKYGVGLAYRVVLKDQSTWKDVRGIWINTPWGQIWITGGSE